MQHKGSSATPTEEEIAHGMAGFIGELGKRGEDQEDKTRILFSAAVNATMLFIVSVKLLTGDTTENCRKHAIELMNEQIGKADTDGDTTITWKEEGEASA